MFHPEWIRIDLLPNWDLLPLGIKLKLHHYVTDGTYPGEFLTLILSNKIEESVVKSGLEVTSLLALVGFISRALPVLSWGSEEAVMEWMESRSN